MPLQSNSSPTPPDRLPQSRAATLAAILAAAGGSPSYQPPAPPGTRRGPRIADGTVLRAHRDPATTTAPTLLSRARIALGLLILTGTSAATVGLAALGLAGAVLHLHGETIAGGALLGLFMTVAPGLLLALGCAGLLAGLVIRGPHPRGPGGGKC